MINNLMQIAAFIMNNADAYRHYDKCSYYMLDGGKAKLEAYIMMDQYTLYVDEVSVTFRDKTVDPNSYRRFMNKYWELTA